MNRTLIGTLALAASSFPLTPGVQAQSMVKADVPFAFSEIHRVLRPGGVFMFQIYPLFFSAYGAHQWDVVNEPWIHLKLGREELIDRIKRASPGGGPDQICHDSSAGQNAEEYRASLISDRKSTRLNSSH